MVDYAIIRYCGYCGRELAKRYVPANPMFDRATGRLREPTSYYLECLDYREEGTLRAGNGHDQFYVPGKDDTWDPSKKSY